MDKLTSIRIKYNDGTYLDKVPIGVLAQNVGYDSGHNLIQVLGSVDVDSNGTIQQQINRLFNEKLNTSDLSSYVNGKITTDVSTWLANNVIIPTGGTVVVDQSLSIGGAAADSSITGKEIDKLRDSIDSILSGDFGTSGIEFEKGEIEGGSNATYRKACRLRTKEIQKLPYDLTIKIISENTRVDIYKYKNGEFIAGTGSYVSITELNSSYTISANTEFRFYVDGRNGLSASELTIEELLSKIEMVVDLMGLEQITNTISSLNSNIDTTLTQSGMAADAKVVGDAINPMRTATASDVGKALKAKTVTDGKVTEWEFGEAGGGSTETDTTLTQSGVPADAKATGDAINDVKNAWGTLTDTLVPSVTTGEYYKISDGTVGTYIACKRTDLIDISGWVSANVTCYGLNINYAGVCYYDKDQTYISGEYDNGKYTDAPLHIPANAKYIGVSSHNSFTISITYTRYITPSETANVIDDLKAKVIDGYIDKNIILFGDSITTELHKYVPALKQIMSFKSLTNYARGYCKWSFYADTVYDITSTGNTASSDNVIWNQYNRLVADVSNETVAIPDAIIIMAGTNDAIYNSNLGTVNDAMAITNIRTAQVGTLNNVCASIRRVIEDIFATFPYTKIIICTPIQQVTQNTRLMNIASCIRELCEYYSIEIPDMFKNVGISYYVEKDADVYLSAGDGGIHPTEAGGKLMANFMKAWLQSHYSYDETIEKTYVPQT